MKACVIAAPMSGSGKTTLTLGLLAVMRRRGITVQPFKVGPDFIDTGLHGVAAGIPSHNLDGWMFSRTENQNLFAGESAGKDVAVVEGVMGLFDGAEGSSNRGSTAEMAEWLDLPVILVLDAHVLARSAAAIVKGFQSFDERIKLAGVIFNRVAGEGHYRILADAVTEVPILGWLPSNPSIQIPERHLGLLTSRESPVPALIESIADFIEQHLDVRGLLDRLPEIEGFPSCFTGGVARSAGVVQVEKRWLSDHPGVALLRHPSSERGGEHFGSSGAPRRVALANDVAFSFYYAANRRELEYAGAEIVEFSPLADREIPDSDFLYIGGGYPEIYRVELEANESMRRSMRRYVESGKPFYAECGGLMYLSQSIDGARMVGVLPTEIRLTERLVDFGYCEVQTNIASVLGPAGTIARGHQFHYSRCTVPSSEPLYTVRQGSREYGEGFRVENGVASYVHLHFLSNRDLAPTMLES